MNKLWLLDTNILVNWVMYKGILDILKEKHKLPNDFLDFYYSKYDNSIKLIEELLETEQEVYITELSLNELFSGVREEVKAVLLFVNGIPLSRWHQYRNQKLFILKEESRKEIYECILECFDELLNNGKRNFRLISTIKPSDNENYFEVYSSFIFLKPKMKTQDTILVTTAIFNHIDYFVTEDIDLINLNKDKNFQDSFNLKIIKAGTAYINLNTK